MNIIGLNNTFNRAVHYLESGKATAILYHKKQDNHQLAEHIFQNAMKLKKSVTSSGKDPFYEIILSGATIFKNIKKLEDLQDVFNHCIDLAKIKNKDYGGSKDNIKITGIEGIVTMLIHKACRIHNLTQTKTIRVVKDEPVWKTAEDIVNYSAFGPMLIDKIWEGEKK